MGPSLFGKFRRSSNHNNSTTTSLLRHGTGKDGVEEEGNHNNNSSVLQPDFLEPSTIPSKATKSNHKNNPQHRLHGVAYQSMGDGGSSVASTTVGGGDGGRHSPETTESNTSAEDEYSESYEDHTDYILQFEPRQTAEAKNTTIKISTNDNPTEEAQQRQLQQKRLQAWVEYQKEKKAAAAETAAAATEQAKNSNQNNNQTTTHASSSSTDSSQTVQFNVRENPDLWSNYLPSVKEEGSFETEDGSTNSDTESNPKQSVLKSSTAAGTLPASSSSPKHNQMMLAMRGLVMKQQQALAEMSDENQMYRQELQECRKLLTLAKEAYTKQKKQLETLSLEKESCDAEVTWLREEVKTLRGEIHKYQNKTTWSSSKSAEEVEERLRRAQAQTPPRRRREQSEMKVVASPSRSRVAPQSPMSTSQTNKAQSVTKPMVSPRSSTTPKSEMSSPENKTHPLEKKVTSSVHSFAPSPKKNIQTTETFVTSPHSTAPKSPRATKPVDRAVSPVPVSSPMISPIQSPKRDWSLKSMLPSIDYLTDEEESDNDAVKDVQQFRASLTGAGVSVKELQERLEKSVSQGKGHVDQRDDASSSTRSPRMRLGNNKESPRYPDDEVRDEAQQARSAAAPPSSTFFQENNHLKSNLRSPRATSPQPMYLKPTHRIPSNTSFSETSSSSEISSQQRAEVTLFKNRLDAIQKKREQRRRIEATAGSRSSRVSFT
jgi:hypothetical protein